VGPETGEDQGGFGSSESLIPNFGIACPVSCRQMCRISYQSKAQNASTRASMSIPKPQKQQASTIRARRKLSIKKTKTMTPSLWRRKFPVDGEREETVRPTRHDQPTYCIIISIVIASSCPVAQTAELSTSSGLSCHPWKPLTLYPQHRWLPPALSTRCYVQDKVT
jgi:hypothetical protein